MPQIVHLPTETLSCVFQALNGFDIANLWLTGDSMLHGRMRNGGVTRFKVKLRLDRTRKWPKLICQFNRLEYLSIGPKRGYSIWFSDVDLLALPRSLKHLKIDFENSELVLLGIPYVVPDLHPDPNLSPPTEGDMILAPLPIADHFTELQTLILNGKFYSLPHILVSQLPQSLLRLRLPYLTIGSNLIQALPPNLTRLELPKVSKLEEGAIFPPGLTSLNLYTLETATTSLMSQIPATMIDLNLQKYKPRDLTFFEFLPPNLTSLALEGDSTDGGGNSIPFPRSLHHLSVRFYENIKKIESFPPGLQTFAILEWSSVALSTFELLPQTITKLDLKSVNASTECLRILPSNLRFLALKVNFPASQVPYSFVKTLEYLHVLELDTQALGNALQLSQIFCHSFAGNDLSALKSLPRLRKLRSHKVENLDQHFAQALPDTMEELRIWVRNIEVDPSVSLYLPRSLKLLAILLNKTISNPFIPHLPPRLTELDLSPIETLSDDSIRLLPRTLERLNLDRVTQLTDEGIRHLPPSLTECSLEEVTLLTDKSAGLFPRNMVRLCINRCTNISDAAVPHFPRTLTTLDLSDNSKLTEKCIPHLPPLLRYFSVYAGPLLSSWNSVTSPTAWYIATLLQEHQSSE